MTCSPHDLRCMLQGLLQGHGELRRHVALRRLEGREELEREDACPAHELRVAELVRHERDHGRVTEDAVTEERVEVHPELRPTSFSWRCSVQCSVSERECGEHLEGHVGHRPRSLLERLEGARERRKRELVHVLADEVAVEGLTNGIGFALVVAWGRANHLDDVRHGRALTDRLAEDDLGDSRSRTTRGARRLGAEPNDFRPVTPERTIWTKFRSILPSSMTRGKTDAAADDVPDREVRDRNAGMSFILPSSRQ